MPEVDLSLIRRMLEDLWRQMDRSEFQFHDPPPGALGYWTRAYNRYLAQVRPQFADDPVFAQFEELPEGTPFGTVQMAVGHLHTYLEYHLRGDQAGASPGDVAGLGRNMAALGRRIAQMGRAVHALPGESAEAELEARLAELTAHLEDLEQRLAEKLGEQR